MEDGGMNWFLYCCLDDLFAFELFVFGYGDIHVLDTLGS